MRTTIAQCCLNAAAMLDIADDGQRRDINAMQRLQKANRGQAELLREAARIADELAAALLALAVLGEQGMKPDYNEWLTFHDKVAHVAREALSKVTIFSDAKVTAP